jgi:hypothetical protein
VSVLRDHQASEALTEAMRVMDDLLPTAITWSRSA